MPSFSSIYKEYEKTNNVCKFCSDYEENDVATRFLLVRSLDKPNLKDVIESYSDESSTGDFATLTEKAYNSSITIDQLIDYIESHRAQLVNQRQQEIEGLENVLSNIPVVNCGVRNDKIEDIVKSFVRNKSIKTWELFEHELDSNLLPKVRQYTLWSYYNQTSNDIIELAFLKHPAVIPTLRKIHDIDFFIRVGNKIVPFDLKFTHISDSYFDLASQGIIRNTTTDIFDDFFIDQSSDTSEIKIVKKFYNQLKKSHPEYSLPNLAGLEKNDLCELLINTGNTDAEAFVTRIKQRHSDYVPSNADQLYALEWWNYKYQGERLFCNNNRLFVFLAYRTKFVDGRELKGRISEISEKINSLLDTINESNIHSVHYRYEKETSLIGNYTALSLSTIFSE